MVNILQCIGQHHATKNSTAPIVKECWGRGNLSSTQRDFLGVCCAYRAGFSHYLHCCLHIWLIFKWQSTQNRQTDTHTWDTLPDSHRWNKCRSDNSWLSEKCFLQHPWVALLIRSTQVILEFRGSCRVRTNHLELDRWVLLSVCMNSLSNILWFYYITDQPVHDIVKASLSHHLGQGLNR